MSKAELKIYCDGGARGNPGPAAAAFVVVLGGKTLLKKGRFIGKMTNNFAEYTGVVFALTWVLNEKRKEDVQLYLDSQLVVNQLRGRFKIKQPELQKLAMKIKNLEKKFPGRINYYSIPRSKNRLADLLVNETLDVANRVEIRRPVT